MNKLYHIAFIMDGNGRWGKKKKRNRNFGHLQGVETVKKIVLHQVDDKMEVGMDVGGFLDRFGGILGPTWELSWGQVGTKTGGSGVPRRSQKIIKNLETPGFARSRGAPICWPLIILQY